MEVPIPPPVSSGDNNDPEKSNRVLELGNPAPSSAAPRYSTTSNAQPAQLQGDSSFPVELSGQSQGPVSPIVADYVYELPNPQPVIGTFR
ncbi:hypothetical protein TWF694_011260 [Orbilia ellipsospora]|uniref:Uncharacterized protein n=1 Tax=Orbilia ellipsospora TaxID=2528407 RepID=A0AAV9X9P4_9PEZI